MLVICIICVKIAWQVNARYQKVSKQLLHLQNELRGMSSGHLGMGREIRKALKGVANVETLQEQVNCSGVSEKTYQQAGLLLARGATIEEVVESFEIAPAEAELLAIMHHSAPSYQN